MLKIAFAEALFKFVVYDLLHAWVNRDRRIFVVDDRLAFLDVKIDTLVHQGFRVQSVRHYVEAISSLERKSESLIVLREVVEDFARDVGGKLLLGESVVVHERLDPGELV